MAGTIKMFCIKMNILSHSNNTELFLPCNVAVVHNLYIAMNRLVKSYEPTSGPLLPELIPVSVALECLSPLNRYLQNQLYAH